MRAMVFDGADGQLRDLQVADPVPAAGQLLIDVHTCGVCRTDLHLVDHELPHPKRPVIPGHEIVGTVAAVGPGVSGFSVGQRVGVPWVGHTCGQCRYCRSGRENLCDEPGFTGTRLTAAMRSARSPTAAIASICRNNIRTWRQRRCCARD